MFRFECCLSIGATASHHAGNTGHFVNLGFILKNSSYENSECEGVSNRKKSRVVLVIPGYATLYNNEGSEIAHEMRSLINQPGNS